MLGAGHSAISAPPATIAPADPDPHHERRDDQVEFGRRWCLHVFTRHHRERDHALVGTHQRDRFVADLDDPFQPRRVDIRSDRGPYVARHACVHRHMADRLTADQVPDRALAGFAGVVEILTRRQRRYVLACLGHIEHRTKAQRGAGMSGVVLWGYRGGRAHIADRVGAHFRGLAWRETQLGGVLEG